MARNKHPEETVNKIVEVALKLFIEKGYEHTSIQEIIDGLGGLTKGAIYHHFKSKEDILLAVVNRLYSGQGDSWPELMKPDNPMNGMEKLREMFCSSLNNPSQNEMVSAAPNMLQNPKILALHMQSIYEDSAPHFVTPIIEQGIKDGSIQTEYPLQLAEAILLLINMWLSPMVFYAEPPVFRKRLEFFRQLLSGIGVDFFDDDMMARMEQMNALYAQNR